MMPMEKANCCEGDAVRVLFVLNDKFPPFRNDIAVLVVKELVQKRGYVIDWVLQSDKPRDRSSLVQWAGGRAFVAAMNRGRGIASKVSKHLSGVLNDLSAIKLIRRERYSVVLVKDRFWTAIPILWAAKKRNLPALFWLSYPFPEMYRYRSREKRGLGRLISNAYGLMLQSILYRVIGRTATHVLVQSEQMRKDVASRGISREKTTAIPMGIPNELLEPKHVDCGALGVGGEPRIVYLGTLLRDRKLDFLVRVLKLVRQEIPEAKLVFIGEGKDPKDEAFLRAAIENEGLSETSVEFTGFLPMPEAWKHVRCADVCVSPFYPTEILLSTSPTKMLEYLALERPTVVTAHPEQEIIARESGGALCVEYDEKAFAGAVVQLLGDAGRAATLASLGRKWVAETRTYDRLGARLHSILEQTRDQPH